METQATIGEKGAMQVSRINGGLFRANANGVTKPIVLPGITLAPGGGMFVGCIGSTISNRGDIAFTGLVQRAGGPIERGVFVARAHGPVVRVAGAGDAAPGDGVFSSFAAPSIAPNGGDVAFMAKVGTERKFGIYVSRGPRGTIEAIARPGSPAPRGGVFGSCFSPVLNNRGDIAFTSNVLSTAGIFLSSRGKITAVVMPSDPLPGNHFVDSVGSHYLNDRGDVAFDVTQPFAGPCDIFGNSGLYVSAHGEVRLVANAGLLISGVGTLDDVFFSHAKMNDRGEILFQATLTDGRVVLLIAKPIEENDH